MAPAIGLIVLPEGPISIPCQTLSDLCWTKWYWDRVSADYFRFACQYHSTAASYTFIHVSLTLFNISKWRLPWIKWKKYTHTHKPKQKNKNSDMWCKCFVQNVQKVMKFTEEWASIMVSVKVREKLTTGWKDVNKGALIMLTFPSEGHCRCP